MAEGTPIGALAVRIVGDVGDFVADLNRADKAVDKFSRQIDKRLTEPLAKVSAAAAAAGAAVFAFTKSAADIVDELGKLSQKVGVSVESLSALKYAAELSDVSLESLGTGLKQLSKFMVENRIEGVSVEEQLLRIAEEFGRTNDGAAKTAAAMKYFGKSGADLIPLLNQGRDGIAALRAEAERLGIVFTSEAARRAEEFNDNLTRLKSAAQGLQVHFAGPFVEALNSAAKAMLEARNQGESLFDTLVEGFRRMVTGDDTHKWNVQFTEAVDELLDAEKRLSEAKARSRIFDPFGEGVKAAERRVAAAKAEIERLQAIKPILAPDVPPAPERPRAGDPTVPREAAAVSREAEFIARQWQEAMDEEVRVRAEVAQLMSDYRAAELERERAFQDERNRILIEAYDREQEEAIRQGEELLEIERNREQNLTRLGYTHRQMNLAAAKTFFGHMAGLMNTQSKKLFEIGKAAAIAETIINTHAAAMAAYRALAGIPIVGPALGAAAAAAAIAAGAAQIQAIRSQSVGGGGAVGTFAASPQTGQPVGTPGGDVGTTGGGRGGPDTIIHLHGENFGRKQLRDLLERLNEEGRDGGRIILAGSA